LINRYTDVHQLNRSSLLLRVVQFAEITINWQCYHSVFCRYS
jgi:hypothetical protein